MGKMDGKFEIWIVHSVFFYIIFLSDKEIWIFHHYIVKAVSIFLWLTSIFIHSIMFTHTYSILSDSGGPLYDKENDALVGIVSFGIGCASPLVSTQ